ncbi:MAG TPA: hypothetical protein VM166_09600 [Gemmatimonadaceae bacterium]|nr:hypothetical protein [Gemmatimonadaceae bacterium]
MSQVGSRYRMLAEVASAAAVALTLLFVGLQLREASRQTALNTTSLQVAAYQDLNAQISHFNELLLDPSVAQVWERMLDRTWDWSKFDPVQRRQARSLLYMRIRHADMAFYEFERGMLSEDRLGSALRPLLSDIDRPIFRSFWEEVGPLQIPAFRDYLNKRIAQRAGGHPNALPNTR